MNAVICGAGLNLDAPAFYDVSAAKRGERSFYRGPGAVGIVGYRVTLNVWSQKRIVL